MPNDAATFNLLSSTIANAWHEQNSPQAYEWWYFDAISDDGREAVVIIFLDNFVFSPRYNEAVRKMKKGIQISDRFPAVAFFYYRDGKPLYRSINEYTNAEFRADTEKPYCQIGNSKFSFECAPYGSGYLIDVETNAYGNRKLKARFEWLSVESDLMPEKRQFSVAHNWNLVVARADVTGKIQIFDEKGKLEQKINFRGTGYHDHNADTRWMPETVEYWHWGRAHFSDSTTVFYHYKEFDQAKPMTKLILVRKNSIQVLDAHLDSSRFRMNSFGLTYASQLTFSSQEGFSLSVRQRVADASFFYLRFWSEAEIKYPNGQSHIVPAISEYLFPKRLRKSWFDKLIDMRIGRCGKSASLP